jgi:hypothetical protein
LKLAAFYAVYLGAPMPASHSSPSFFRHFQNLQIHFRGQLRAQLKPLAVAVGVGEMTIRNNGNIFKINGCEVRPSITNGRLTYDLAEIAEALAAQAAPETPVPKAQAPRGRERGRPSKPNLLATEELAA